MALSDLSAMCNRGFIALLTNQKNDQSEDLGCIALSGETKAGVNILLNRGRKVYNVDMNLIGSYSLKMRNIF